MSHTLQTLLPWLQLAAGSGSGVIASGLFTEVRIQVPHGYARWPWLETAIWSPRAARVVVLVLAAIIAIAASVGVAYVTAGDVPAAFDLAASAAISGVMSQVWHLPQLPSEPPTPLGGPRG